jgi:pimeloyl-ACP methyl ester carboxylesterase
MRAPQSQVLLVHGLWLNRASMYPLGLRLRHAGFAVRYHGYYSALLPQERHIEQLITRLRGDGGDERPHVIAHSLGAVLALQALCQLPALPGTKSRLIGLGAPWRGSDAGRQFMRHAFGRFCVGSTGRLWQTFPELQAPAGVEVGAIAGTRRIGMGRFFARLEGANDGVVTVEETRLDGLADHIVMPVSHTGMLLSGEAAQQCAAFLRGGRFSR